MQDLHNSCASLAGLVLCFIASFIACFILLVIAPLFSLLLAPNIGISPYTSVWRAAVNKNKTARRTRVLGMQWTGREGERQGEGGQGGQASLLGE